MKALRAVAYAGYDEDVKRDRLVTIRLSAEDLARMKEAGKQLWPADAPPTNSTLVLTLAKRGADQILKTGRKK